MDSTSRYVGKKPDRDYKHTITSAGVRLKHGVLLDKSARGWAYRKIMDLVETGELEAKKNRKGKVEYISERAILNYEAQGRLASMGM